MKIDLDDLIDFLLDLGLPDGVISDLSDYLVHEAQNAELPDAENLTKIDPNSDTEDVSHDFLYAVADQRHLIQRPARKWYVPTTKIGDRRGGTRLTKKRGICFHHTAVKGGFGTHKPVVRNFLAQLTEGAEPPRILIPQCNILKVNKVLTTDQLVRLHALGARYRGAGPTGKYNQGIPYHALRGPNSVLYLNLPFDWVTWASNGANNDFLAFAWDARSAVEMPEPEDMIEDILYLYDLMRTEGHCADECEFTAHSVYTNKGLDPWKHYIREVMIPAAEKVGAVLRMDYKSRKRGSRSLAETLAA